MPVLGRTSTPAIDPSPLEHHVDEAGRARANLPAMGSQPLFRLYELDRELGRDELVDALAATPASFREILLGQRPEDLVRRPDGGGWSPIEVIRHVRDVVQVYGMRFKWIILQDDPFLPNYDEDRWVAESPDGPDQLAAMLDELAVYRAETVRLLRALPPAGWSRRGRHEVLGSVDLEPYVRHQLAHEEQHLAQLAAALR